VRVVTEPVWGLIDAVDYTDHPIPQLIEREPEELQLLGANGLPLLKEKPRMGFDLTPRKR
jgi:hypothetical protein